MNQDDLKEVLRLHRVWMDGEDGGERADLCGANLREAGLCEADLSEAHLCLANLSGADLRGADLGGADLGWANLCWADLCVACFKGSDLSGADLRSADLRDADLSGANLRGAIGDGKRIKTLIGLKYHVNIWDDMMSIGCQQHKIDEWFEFDDETIAEMDDGALEWWNANKQFLKDFIERLKNEQ